MPSPNTYIVNDQATETDALNFKPYVETLADIIQTGNTPLTIVWEDGHDYGIFNWHYLRALCPCEEDRAKYGIA